MKYVLEEKNPMLVLPLKEGQTLEKLKFFGDIPKEPSGTGDTNLQNALLMIKILSNILKTKRYLVT